MEENRKKYLKEIAGWTKFFAVLSVVSIAFLVAMAVLCFVMNEAVTESLSAGFPGGGIVLGITYLVIAVVMVIPTVFLFKSAAGVKAGVASEDDALLTEGIRNGKSYLKFLGILEIAALGICLLGVILALIVG